VERGIDVFQTSVREPLVALDPVETVDIIAVCAVVNAYVPNILAFRL